MVHNDRDRRVTTAEQIYTDLYRLRMLSTSIIICRWDDAGKDRDRGEWGWNQVGGIYALDQK